MVDPLKWKEKGMEEGSQREGMEDGMKNGVSLKVSRGEWVSYLLLHYIGRDRFVKNV